MPRFTAHEHRPDALTDFAEELRQLAETVLERVEPALRNAAEGRTEWSSCSWCPVCAAAALLRGEHHDVLTAIADHGTAIVTVLREALAGAPVEPVMPTDEPADPATRRAAHDSVGGEASAGAGPAHEGATHHGSAAGRGEDRSEHRAGGVGDPSRSARHAGSARKRPGYTDIPVTIRI